VVLSARIEDQEPIPRPSQPARGQRHGGVVADGGRQLSIYQAMRARKMTTGDLSRRLGGRPRACAGSGLWRRRSRLEDIEGGAGQTPSSFEVGNAA